VVATADSTVDCLFPNLQAFGIRVHCEPPGVHPGGCVFSGEGQFPTWIWESPCFTSLERRMSRASFALIGTDQKRTIGSLEGPMKEQEFKRLDHFASAIHGNITDLEKSGALKEFLEEFQSVAADLPKSHIMGLRVLLDVWDSAEEKSLDLLNTGFSCPSGESHYRTSGDVERVRYVVDGEICVVPDDQCPHCWGEWIFKSQNPQCPDCGCELGNEVKLLLDSDQCPACENGTITRSNPVCDICGYRVDPTTVVWG
jgi:hypothetical protein